MQGLSTIQRRSPPFSSVPAKKHGRVGLSARAKRPRFQAPPLLVTKEEAARVLGMSISHFQRHVQSEIKCVYSGQLTLYHYSDLKRWADNEATIGGRAA